MKPRGPRLVATRKSGERYVPAAKQNDLSVVMREVILTKSMYVYFRYAMWRFRLVTSCVLHTHNTHTKPRETRSRNSKAGMENT